MRPTYCAECNGHLDPYLPDCPECGAHVPDSDEHHDQDIVLDHDHPAGHRTAKRRWRIHVPWGLFAILVMYAGGVSYYIHWHEENSPQVIAARHIMAAEKILGRDNGASATNEKLTEAYEHLLQALSKYPDDKWSHEQIEDVERQLLRRGRKPDPGQQRRSALLANVYAQIQQGRSGPLPVGPRDEWDVDAVLNFPDLASRWAMIGGLIIILLWMYREFQDYQHFKKHEDERHLDRREELRHLHVQRRR